MSSNVKTRFRRSLIFPRFDKIMDFQIKLFSWPDRGNHLIMITRGMMDAKGFDQIFHQLLTATQSLRDCKVVIDLQDAMCNLQKTEIQAFIAGVELDGWPSTNRVAIVASREIGQYDQLFALTNGLANRGLRIAVFNDPNPAFAWLAEPI